MNYLGLWLKRLFWLTPIEYSNIKGFLVFCIIQNIELRPETRALIIRELLAMQRLACLDGCANGDSGKSNEQRPKNYIRHMETFNVEVTDAARLYRAASVWTAGLGVLLANVVPLILRQLT